MNRSPVDKERLMAEATDWLARLNDDKVALATRNGFVTWLMRSCGNVDAFLDAAAVFGQIGHVKSMPRAAELARAVREEPRDSNVVHLRPSYDDLEDVEPVHLAPVPRRSLFKVAAAVTLAVATGSLALVSLKSWDHSKTLFTQVGEQRSVSLEDGTTVHLNTNTALTVRFEKTMRRIALLHGEARFEVAKDSKRPFVVTTPQAVVRALGTAFNVRIVDERTVVSVMEGHIRVVNRSNSDSEPLAPVPDAKHSQQGASSQDHVDVFTNGQIAVEENGRMQRDGGPPFGRAVGWTKHSIVFKDETLAVLVAEFNRYNTQLLEIADPSLAEHRIDGRFDAFDRSSLLDYLRHYQGVQIDEEHGKLMMRRARSVTPGR